MRACFCNFVAFVAGSVAGPLACLRDNNNNNNNTNNNNNNNNKNNNNTSLYSSIVR